MSLEALSFLAAPIALSILLVGIHAYLGLHVLERDVIFVDISLSQVAALGSALSLFFIHEEHSHWGLGIIFSLSLCLLAAFILSLLRYFEKQVSQEALIGITYALASGSLILVMNQLPNAGEHLKEALVGNILFVTWPTVLETASIYAVIGLVHIIFQKQFWSCSRGVIRSPKWDFFFYLLFGVVITFSTHHAGVLVVFSILVVPASFAKRLVKSTSARLFVAWGFGIFGILLAFALSLKFDFPAGAAIVTTLTGIFFIFLFIKLIDEYRKGHA